MTAPAGGVEWLWLLSGLAMTAAFTVSVIRERRTAPTETVLGAIGAAAFTLAAVLPTETGFVAIGLSLVMFLAAGWLSRRRTSEGARP